jgi:hypothetical protein
MKRKLDSEPKPEPRDKKCIISSGFENRHNPKHDLFFNIPGRVSKYCGRLEIPKCHHLPSINGIFFTRESQSCGTEQWLTNEIHIPITDVHPVLPEFIFGFRGLFVEVLLRILFEFFDTEALEDMVDIIINGRECRCITFEPDGVRIVSKVLIDTFAHIEGKTVVFDGGTDDDTGEDDTEDDTGED